MALGRLLPGRVVNSEMAPGEEEGFTGHLVVVSGPGAQVVNLSHLQKINIRTVHLGNLEEEIAIRGRSANMGDVIRAHLEEEIGSFRLAALLLSITRIIAAGRGTQPHNLVVSDVGVIMAAQIAGSTLFGLVTPVQNAGKCTQLRHTEIEALRPLVPQHHESVDMSQFWCQQISL